MISLLGKRALVTGGASGIGFAIAEEFINAGADVTIIDHDITALRGAATVLGCRGRLCDLSDLHAVSELDLNYDIIVNNAGIQHVARIEDFPVDKFSYIMRVMLEAPFRLIHWNLPYMYEKGWGRIINVSSVHGLRASAFKSAYVTAKHGLEGLSKVVALEGAEHGVTSNCLNPAYVRTPLVEKQIAGQAVANGISENEVLEKIMLAPVAVKRLIDPSEVAALALFLCGPNSNSMTGASYLLDGGWTSH